jgi:hypothetical protein
MTDSVIINAADRFGKKPAAPLPGSENCRSQTAKSGMHTVGLSLSGAIRQRMIDMPTPSAGGNMQGECLVPS